MAAEIASWFSTFQNNQAIANAGAISTRYKRITQRLNTDYWETTSEFTHSIYVGSYGRDTGIEGISDIDMAFWLPPSVYEKYKKHSGNGPSALLQSVRASIQKTYPATTLSADGQVLVVQFGQGLPFEVLPCFEHSDGSSFIYPDSRAEILAIRYRNDAANGNLKRLCKMMRAWRHQSSVPISGVLIDTLAYQFIENWEHRDKSFLYHDWMSRDFFDYLAIQNRDQNYWLAPGSGRNVHRDGLFEYKARVSCNIAKEAIQHGLDQREYSAKIKWREIYGNSFPG